MKLHEYTAHQLTELLAAKEVSAVELTQDVLQKITQVEPQVQAYLCVDEEFALKQAADIDRRRAAGEQLGILAGIPYALKDNIATKEMKTTCASRMLENFQPPYNATVYQKLQNADGILLGKVNMDEFAMGSTGETSFFGAVKNPIDEKRVAGGSSSGSAAAVAEKSAVFALGTDTGGSVRLPAAFCWTRPAAAVGCSSRPATLWNTPGCWPTTP